MIKFKRIDLLLTYSSTGLVMVASLLTMALVNSKLGLESYGKLTFILAVTGFLSMLFSIRSGEAVVKFLTAGHILKNDILSSALIFDIVVFVLNILVLIGGTLAYFCIFREGEVGDLNLVLLLGFSSAIQIISGVPNGVLLFKEDFKVLSLIRVVMPLVRISLLLGFYFLTDFTLEWVCLAFSLSSLAGVLVNWMFFYVKDAFRFHLPFRKVLNEYVRVASVMYTSLFFKSTLMNADTIILGLIVSAEKLGVYQTIKLLVQPINLLVNPLGKMIYPKFSKAITANNMAVVIRSIGLYSAFFLCVGVSVIVTISIFHDVFKFFTQVDVLEYLGFLALFSIQIISLCVGDWWFRSYSNSTDPKYSLIAAIISSAYVWGGCLICSIVFDEVGFIISMIILFIVRSSVFWWLLLSKRAAYEV